MPQGGCAQQFSCILPPVIIRIDQITVMGLFRLLLCVLGVISIFFCNSCGCFHVGRFASSFFLTTWIKWKIPFISIHFLFLYFWLDLKLLANCLQGQVDSFDIRWLYVAFFVTLQSNLKGPIECDLLFLFLNFFFCYFLNFKKSDKVFYVFFPIVCIRIFQDIRISLLKIFLGFMLVKYCCCCCCCCSPSKVFIM